MTEQFDKAVEKLIDDLAEILSAEAPDFGKCEICGGPLDLEGLCLDVDCPNYN